LGFLGSRHRQRTRDDQRREDVSLHDADPNAKREWFPEEWQFAIEAAGVSLHSFTAPGAGHGIFEFDSFYDLRVNGVRLVDWLHALITGRPRGDVHCDKCDP